jgi:hypothetical protein
MAEPRTPKRQRRRTVNFIDDRNAVALRFADRETSNRAVGIILEKAPDHAFLFPDPLTIIMNKEDQRLFAGLSYEPEKVAKPGEVTNEEMAELRFENFFGGEIKD